MPRSLPGDLARCHLRGLLQHSLVKTTNDLLLALITLIADTAGRPPEVIQALLKNAPTHFPMDTPEPMTDAEFDRHVAAIKTELPAFLRDLGITD